VFNLEFDSSRLFHISSVGHWGESKDFWHRTGLCNRLPAGEVLNLPVESCATFGLGSLQFGYQFFSIFINACNQLKIISLFLFDPFEIDRAFLTAGARGGGIGDLAADWEGLETLPTAGLETGATLSDGL
jgi:hypothetical protein